MEVRRIRNLASDRPLEFQTGLERAYSRSELLAPPACGSLTVSKLPHAGGALQRCGRVVRPIPLKFRASIGQSRYCPLCGFRGGCNFADGFPAGTGAWARISTGVRNMATETSVKVETWAVKFDRLSKQIMLRSQSIRSWVAGSVNRAVKCVPVRARIRFQEDNGPGALPKIIP